MKEKKLFYAGLIVIAVFFLWTRLIMTVDVQPIGVKGTDVGFATLNRCFHKLTGVHMTIYHITDWLGLVPLFCCVFFGGVGLSQLLKRKNLFRVDFDILSLGVHYVIVIVGYLTFEMIPINFRPILIDGRMEASYPSSTALLVLSVIPTVVFQANRRLKKSAVRKLITTTSVLFSLFVVVGRTLSGVHWLTDIIGSVLFASGLYLTYYAVVLQLDEKREKHHGIQ